MSSDPSPMAGLRLRISAAESQRDGWRGAGSQEKYLEACSLVDALELQLDELERTSLASADAPAPPGDMASVMAELSIRFNGRSYGYRDYRYDRFIDAVNYARLDRARGFTAGPGDDAPMEPAGLPTPAERDLMQSLGVTFEGGVFRWREFRYDRVADALAYAAAHSPGFSGASSGRGLRTP